VEGKGDRRVNMVQIQYKNDTCWNCSKNRGEGWIQVWCIWYIVRTFVNTTMYPQPRNTIKKTRFFFFYSNFPLWISNVEESFLAKIKHKNNWNTIQKNKTPVCYLQMP
jgi:hypothetical protein